jgi:hypothetical protein
MQKIANFLQIRTEESLTSIELRESSIGRYGQDFTTEERLRVEAIVRPILNEYEYR